MDDKKSPPYGNTFHYDPRITHIIEGESKIVELTPEQANFWKNQLDTVMISVNGEFIIFRRTAY